MTRLPPVSTLFEGVSRDGPVIAAVSGGSDSMALLLLANSWALECGAELHAVTIDHGFRPEAAAEAAFVSGICAQMGVPHSTLAWDGIKPSFGLQEAARVSRYALLDDFAHEIGAGVILTGHTLDDQAETVFMRAGRLRGDGESDGRGLSGMARITQLYGGTRIVRPLICQSRDDLRRFLVQQGQAWVEDPSNQDESYERVRVRRYLAREPQSAVRAIRLAAASGRLREVLARTTADFLDRHAAITPGPVVTLDLAGKAAGARGNPVLVLALRVLIALAGGREHLVARHRLEPLLSAIAAMQAGQDGADATHTLGGAIISLRPKAAGKTAKAGDGWAVQVVIVREGRGLSSLLLEPGETAVWDGRLHLHNGTADPVFVEPAQRRDIAEFERQRGKPYPVAPRRALLSTPILHVQQHDANSLPVLPLVEAGRLPKGLETRICCVAIEHFCPQWDFALRDWVASLDSHASASLQP